MGCAFVTVYVPVIAWWLGLQNQLKLIGFLLSAMNLCLMATLPKFLLRCEAALGQSTIQNFEAIFSNQALRSHVDWRWRSTIFLLLALPPGLGVLYKEFFGGHAFALVAASDELYNDQWGLYAPPGLLPLGNNMGTILMYNASTPFLVASTNSTAKVIQDYNDPANDIPLPSSLPQAYGFNTLLLNTTAAALVDAPPPDWVQDVQAHLRTNEVWNVSATVLATVSSMNTSIEAHRAEPMNSSFWSPNFGSADTNRWIWRQDGWGIGFSSNMLGYGQDMHGSSDSSWCFIALVPPNGTIQESAQMWSTVRKACRATWGITQTSVSLLNGDCDDSLDAMMSTQNHQQAILQDNTLDLTVIYNQIVEEFVAPFMSPRNQSHWLMPTMAVTVASMYWSRIAAVSGPGSPHWRGNDTYSAYMSGKVYDAAGLQYSSDAIIYSSRVAMRKSVWLSVVFAVQPALTFGAMVASVLLRHVPISKGFGIVSVLAGTRPESVVLLRGAGYSGELTRATRLAISVHDEGSSGIGYTTYEIDP